MPRCAIAHLRSGAAHHPGMTVREKEDVDGRDAPGHNGEDGETVSHLRRDQILDLHPVALFDDLRDPLPVAMGVIALVAEDADRA